MSKELLVLLSPRSSLLSRERLVDLAIELKIESASYLAASENEKLKEAGIEYCTFGFSRSLSKEKNLLKLFLKKLFYKYLLCPFTLFFKTLLSFPRLIIAAPSVYSLIVFFAGFLILSKRVLVYEQHIFLSTKESNSYVYNIWVRLSNYFLPLLSSKIFVSTKCVKENIIEFYPDFFKSGLEAKIQVEVFSLPKISSFDSNLDDLLSKPKEWKKHLAKRAELRNSLLSRLQISEKSLVLLSCSPLEENYSLEPVLRAIYAANKNAYLIIRADGGERNQALSMIVGLGLSEQVVLLPESEPLTEILPAVDSLILTSGEDGLSEYFLDAIELSVPIIAPQTKQNEEFLSISAEGKDKISFFDSEHVGELSVFLKDLNKNRLEELGKKSFLIRKKWPKNWKKRVSKELAKSS